MSGADWLNLEKLATSGGIKKPFAKDVAQKQSIPRPNKNTGGGSHGRSDAAADGRSPKWARREEEWRVESPVFELDGLTEQDFQLFKTDPLAMCGDLCKEASRVMKKLKIDQERADAERNAAQRRLKELEPEIASLDEIKAKLVEADNARVIAEKDKKLAEDDRANLAKRNKELADQVKSLKAKAARFEEEKQAAIAEKVQEVAGMAKGAAIYQFDNAVAQLKILNAGRSFQFEDKIVRPDHQVEGEEIVVPLKMDDAGKVTQKRSVVFRPKKA